MRGFSCGLVMIAVVSMDGEPIVIHEHITYTFTIINGQPVDCVSAEHIVIANDAIRFEKGRFTCP